MTAVNYASSTAARAGFKDVLDAALHGRAVTVHREKDVAAVVDAARLRATLATLLTHEASLVAEAGGWSAFLPGLPISGSGSTLDDAVDDLVVALREYADDWNDHLSGAPNHRDNWGLVQLVELSDDAALRAWLTRVATR